MLVWVGGNIKIIDKPALMYEINHGIQVGF